LTRSEAIDAGFDKLQDFLLTIDAGRSTKRGPGG
jgi:hypothetical protein